MKTKYLIIVAIVVIAIIIGGAFAYISLQSPSATSVQLNGAGATFPQPFLNATIIAYQSIKPNVEINYQPVGSGAGINALTAKTVDFAASDAPLSSNQTSHFNQPRSSYSRNNRCRHISLQSTWDFGRSSPVR